FAKILTPSDANNGGGFSVPRFCADSVFPPLDFQIDPPVQKLYITDIHGAVWDFRHIYRGEHRSQAVAEEAAITAGMSTTAITARLARAVTEAINRAAKGLPFEVVYYPTAGWSEFVVRAEDVESSMSMFWTPGTRVKMAMETEDSSRITWFQGIVSSTSQETGPWRGSPWKQLQVYDDF
ncbi:unnamed protein product, partial [Arabidopsis halleri]